MAEEAVAEEAVAEEAAVATGIRTPPRGGSLLQLLQLLLLQLLLLQLFPLQLLLLQLAVLLKLPSPLGGGNFIFRQRYIPKGTM